MVIPLKKFAAPIHPVVRTFRNLSGRAGIARIIFGEIQRAGFEPASPPRQADVATLRHRRICAMCHKSARVASFIVAPVVKLKIEQFQKIDHVGG